MQLSRRDALGLAAATVLVGAAGRTASARAATLPVANMEAVLKAAQWDPAKAGEAITAGAGPSVLLVEKALQANGFLATTYVDGHFGTSTVSAYAAYQRSLGYSGLGATGLPGKTSLTKLGAGRFTVSHVITPGARTTYQGKTVNERTVAMMKAARTKYTGPFTLSQGSYNPGGDASSAGTHDGGGVIDIAADSLSGAQRTALVTALRRVGFAAWLRSPAQADWPFHVHAVAISDTDLSAPAMKQVGDYYEGKNGLANHAADDGPKVTKVTYEEYLRSS